MYDFISSILSDKKDGTVFSCFGVYHFLYMIVIFSAIIVVLLFLKNKSDTTKNKLVNVTVNIAFGMYIADFFLMPFAYGAIDIEKLPFHACTAMCVMSFVSRKSEFFSKYKRGFATLGLISNFVYVIYPGGVGQYAVHPLSYRVLQTLLFHGIMTAYGIFALAFDRRVLKPKALREDFAVIAAMTLWAVVGNNLYNGIGDRSYEFNWFFVVQDPFYIIPQNIGVFLMPVLNTVLFFALHVVVFFICYSAKKIRQKSR